MSLGKASLMKASHQPHSNVAHACKLHILVSIYFRSFSFETSDYFLFLSGLVNTAVFHDTVFVPCRQQRPTNFPPNAHNTRQNDTKKMRSIILHTANKYMQLCFFFYCFVISTLFTTVLAFICRVWVLM